MNSQNWVQQFIETEDLPESYQSVAQDYLIPFAEGLDSKINRRPFVLGVNGAQGTGKTTFAKFLSGYLAGFHGLNGSQISLDNFYLTRLEREQRARKLHPLFLTRGVPGTHDTDLAISTLHELKTLQQDETLPLPSFDKAVDDRRSMQDWPIATGTQDFIIFEGWCVGARPVPAAELETPINRLEETEDPDGIWRSAVNRFLKTDYQNLFSLIDVLVFLKVPDFETVCHWRLKQEEKLASVSGEDPSRIMSGDEIAQFVQYFERITRDNLRNLPAVADTIFEFDRDHQMISRRDS